MALRAFMIRPPYACVGWGARAFAMQAEALPRAL